MVFVWIHYELLEISIFNQQILIQKQPYKKRSKYQRGFLIVS